MVAMGGDEDHMRAPADALRDFDAGQAGHSHIEKAHLRLVLQIRVPGIDAVDRLVDDVELGPHGVQRIEQFGARRFLVVGNQGSGGHGCR